MPLPVAKDALLRAVARAARQSRVLRERDRARAQLRDLLSRLHEATSTASALAHDAGNVRSGVVQALRAVGHALGIADAAILEDMRLRLDRVAAMAQSVLALARPIESPLGTGAGAGDPVPAPTPTPARTPGKTDAR